MDKKIATKKMEQKTNSQTLDKKIILQKFDISKNQKILSVNKKMEHKTDTNMLIKESVISVDNMYNGKMFCKDCNTSHKLEYRNKHIKTKKHNENINKNQNKVYDILKLVKNNVCQDLQDNITFRYFVNQIIQLRTRQSFLTKETIMIENIKLVKRINKLNHKKYREDLILFINLTGRYWDEWTMLHNKKNKLIKRLDKKGANYKNRGYTSNIPFTDIYLVVVVDKSKNLINGYLVDKKEYILDLFDDDEMTGIDKIDNIWSNADSYEKMRNRLYTEPLDKSTIYNAFITNENYDIKELPNHKNTYAFYDFVNTELNLVEQLYKGRMKETIKSTELNIKELEDKMMFKYYKSL